MCQPDLSSLTTFVWRAQDEKPMFDAMPPQRRCVDWSLLLRSLETRRVGDAELRSLTNPFRASGG